VSMAPALSRARAGRGGSSVVVLGAASALAFAAFQGLSFVSSPLNQVSAPTLRSRHIAYARGGDAEAEGNDDDEYEFSAGFISYAALESGQEFEGVVTRIASFGAFVDIGAPKAALVPISKMQEGRTENVEDVVKVGQGLTVWIAEADGDRVSLSMVKSKAFGRGGGGGRPARAPAADVVLFQDVEASTWLTGEVVNVQSFGAFVSVSPPSGSEDKAQGLVHITQIKEGFVNDVNAEVSVGDEVKVRVISVDADNQKLGLSMLTEAGAQASSNRPAGGGQRQGGGRSSKDVGSFEGIDDTEWISGKVMSLQNYGAFVEVTAPAGGEPVQGLLHISQIKDGFLEDPGEELEEGQDIKVRVTEVDIGAGKISLSMKQPTAAEEPVADPEPVAA